MSTETKQAKLTVEELLELKWLMGGLLVLLSLWCLWNLDLGVHFLLFAGVALGVATLAGPRKVAALPDGLWKVAGPLLLVLIGTDFALNVAGNFLGPLVRMVILLLMYRLVAPRRRREDLQLVLLCLFCLVISGVMTVSLLFALQILIFTPLAMALLFVICLLDYSADGAVRLAEWQRFRWRRLLRRVATVLDMRVLLLGTGLFLFVVAVSALVFVSIPRFNLDQALPYLQVSGQARSGFTDTVQLGAVSDIKEDTSVALRIDVPSLDAMESSPYWRMLVLDKYSDGLFRMSQTLRSTEFRSYRRVRRLTPPDAQRVRMVSENRKWTFYLEGGVSRYLPLPAAYGAMRFQTPEELELLPQMGVVGLESVRQSVFSYQLENIGWRNRIPAARRTLRQFSDGTGAVVSDTGGVPSPESPESPAEYPKTTRELPLDPEETAYLEEINAGLAETDGAAAYSRRLTDYLWENYQYSLSPSDTAGPGDNVVNWLREGRRGHCEYFAGAFILLAREAGYPARMVVGFAGGAWNSVEEYFVVRHSNAHAWVEIFDAEAGEWLRVDPTPGSGSSDPSFSARGGMEFETGWGAWVDSLRIQWYRRVVNFDESDQEDLLQTAGAAWEAFAEGLKAQVRGIAGRLKAWLQAPFERENLWFGLGWLGALAGVFLLWRWRLGWMDGLRDLLCRRRTLDPVRRQAGVWLRRLRDAEGPVGCSESEAVLAGLREVRYGPSPDAEHARRLFRRARHVLRASRKAGRAERPELSG